MTKIRTYLEMTSVEEIRPGRFVPDVELVPTSDQALIRQLHVRVGTPHSWGSATRTDEVWARDFARPELHFWAVMHGAEPVGIVALGDHWPEVEIETFGLVPEAVGRGIGGHVLTLTLQLAWALRAGVERVWLHTSTQDHANALPNYQARGLRPYRTEARD